MHSSVDGCLGYFHCGAFMNNAAVNIYVQFFAQMYLFTSLGYMQEYSCWIVWYLFVHLFEELPKCFPKWLHHVTVLPAISLPPNYIIIVFMSVIILEDVKGHSIVVLVCISLMTNKVEHLKNVHILALCIYLRRNVSLNLLPILKLNCLFTVFVHGLR